jgi:urea transporter
LSRIKSLRLKWLHLASSSRFYGYTDALLRGYSQVIFCNSPLVGAILLSGFIDSPVAGLLSLLGSISSLATAAASRVSTYLLKSGFYVWNGALTGLALAAYTPFSLKLILLTLAGGMLSAALTTFFYRNLQLRYDLPLLSMPFVLVTWLLLVVADLIVPLGDIYLKTPGFAEKGLIETLLLPRLPIWMSTGLHIMSAMFFQDSIIIGIIVLAGILSYSRISALFGLAGGIAGLALYRLMVPFPVYNSDIVIGFNCALVGLALGGFYLKLTWQALFYAGLAVILAVLFGIGFTEGLGRFNIPALTGPFNLVTLMFMLIIRALPETARGLGLHLVPLVLVDKPEATLNCKSFTGKEMTRQCVKLTLPFYGTWIVSNGNFSHPTHVGASSYAWDFIVVDGYGRSFLSTGRNNEDFYCFGLPIIAPADGRVVKMIDSVPDNTPPNVNMEFNWGNHIIIDHGNSEFSEISHMLQNSVKVKVGDEITRGQLLGYCGNSGFAYAPHIHFQVQNIGVTGSNSVPAVFSDYVVHKGLVNTTVDEGIPRRGELVSGQSA